MAVLLFFILLMVSYFFYHQLLGRMKHLEQEVRRLQQLCDEKEKADAETEIAEREIISPISPSSVVRENHSIPEENIPIRGSWISLFFSFVRENILSVSGIVTLILGIGYFVKYAIDKNWIGETTRVAIGVLVGIVLATIGFLLRRNYRIFSYILTGGAVVMLYFSITLGFQEYFLFSPSVAFVILLLITLVATALAYFYSSEVLFLIATIGGFCAPLMASNGESNYPFVFGYISLLNFGMLAIILLKKWRSIGWVCFVISSLYFFFWIADKTEALSVLFLYLSYFIFYAFALANYFRKNTLQKFDILMLVLVNILAVSAVVYVFRKTNMGPVVFVPLSFVLVNALLLVREFRMEKFTIAFSVFSGLVISLVTFAVAVYLDNFVTTSLWAVESVLLMYLWLKTEQQIFKRFFKAIFILLIISQLLTWMNYYEAEHFRPIRNRVFLTSLWSGLSVVVNLYLMTYFHQSKSLKDRKISDVLGMVAFLMFYFTFFFEIAYQVQNIENQKVGLILLVYSVFYIFFVLLLQGYLKIESRWAMVLMWLSQGLFVATSVYGTAEDSIFAFQASNEFYFFYLLYLIPVLYTAFRLFRTEDYWKKDYKIWLLLLTLVFVICTLLYQFYLVFSYGLANHFFYLQQRFLIFYLPILWTVIGVLIIYIGIRKTFPVITKFGFALIGLMVLKLYLYDIWKMDSVSRIIAFIVLGLILLTSSFTFQKLTKVLKNMMEKEHK